MKRNMPFLFLVLLSTTSLSAQQVFKYSADLTAITNDRLTVTMQVPPLKQATVEFSFPKMIPGTYRIADYGKFVGDVRAFDKSGKALPVKKTGSNTWKISNATSLSKITYTVEDIFDTEVKHNIYPMAATNFEPGNISLHTPGIFGFIEGYNQSAYEISMTKPASMYGATSMQPVSYSSTHETYRAANLNELYESPVMYTVPDTTSVTVGNAQVLVSVYSPGKLVRSKQIAEWMHDLLEAARQYLGGRLPTDKYAFLFYFKDLSAKHSFPENLMGALEHPASSYYYLPDIPAEEMKSSIIDIASHEFFHIVTPLTIASREVKQFNYTQPKMSQHLWLYEGSTEYTAHHVQVKYGLKTVNQFLEELSSKITVSRRMYDDKLPFTELSRHATDRHRAQYGNVYQKGALIAACLDLLLLDLSGGTYGFRNLTYDLGIRYGKDRFFEDDQLFDEIAALTWP
ncbi:MAG TPA: peptidase M61, partial [Flavisolibacter sp.]